MLKKTETYSIMSLLILFSLFINKSIQTLLLSSITADNYTISAITDYTFQLNRFATSIDIPSGSQLLVIFPSQYSISSTNDCQPVDWLGLQSITCEYSESILTIPDGFQQASQPNQLIFKVNNIQNPFPAKQYSFQVRIRYPNNTNEDSQIYSVTLVPGLAICSSISTGQVFDIGQVVIAYNSTFFDIDNPNYKLSISMNRFYPSDSLQNDIQASLIDISYTQLDAYLFSLQKVYNQIKISMRMPPSTAPQIDFIYILSTNLQDDQVDYCYITIQGMTPNQFEKPIQISQETVQQKTNIDIKFTSNSIINPSDKFQIDFTDTQFNLDQIGTTAIFFQGSTGQKPLQRSDRIIQISNLATVSTRNVQYGFTLTNIIMPPTDRIQKIQFTLQTSTDAVRDQQTSQYSSLPGQILLPIFQCIKSEIGTETTCYGSFTFASQIPNDGYIQFTFPGEFYIELINSNCKTSGTNIKVLSQCDYIPDQNSIRVSNLIKQGQTIGSGTTININLQNIKLPVDPQVYQIDLSVHDFDASLIDTGIFEIQVTKKSLTSFSITSDSLETNTITNFNVQFQFDQNQRSPYTLQLYFPFTNVSSISVNNNVLSSNFNQVTQILTISPITSGQLIIIKGFKNHISTKPLTLTGNIMHNNTIYYYFNGYDISASQPQQIPNSGFTFTQSNHIVNQVFIATFRISQLSVNDVLQFDTDFYAMNQSDCSDNCQCNSNGYVRILEVNNIGGDTTQIKLNLQNALSITTVNTNVVVLDQTEIYKKKIKQFQIQTLQTNTLQIDGRQTNPYYGQQSTYTFNIRLTTPLSSQSLSNYLQFYIPSFAYTVIDFQCLLGCTSNETIQLKNNISFIINSTILKMVFTIQNSINKDLFKQPIIIRSNSLGYADSGQFINQYPCSVYCRQCLPQNTSHCLNCYNETIWQYDRLDQNTCVSDCPSGKYLQAKNNSCQPCSSNCINCATNSTYCYHPCNTDFYHYNYQCISNCPSATFKSEDFRCIECSNNCLECQSSDNCLQCSSTTFLFDGQCTSECPVKTYPDIFTRNCQNCIENCLQCQNSYECIQCNNGFYLNEKSCVQSCPQYKYQANTTCQNCVKPCLECTSQNQCVSCISQTFLYTTDCSLTCPPGYFKNVTQRTCDQCLSPCLTCAQSKTFCLQCKTDIFFNNQCLITCPQNYYSHQQNSLYFQNTIVQKCKQCTFPCYNCDLFATNCTSCPSGYFLYNNSCFRTCPDQYYGQNNLCLQCVSPCLLCNQNGCLSCDDQNLYLQNQQCISQCTQLHPNNQTMKCEQCRSPCQTCTWSNQCLSCISGYAFYNQQCVKNCPSGMYKIQPNCLHCPELCGQCSLENDQIRCSSCLNNSLFFGYLCVQNCPSEYSQNNPYCVTSSCDNIANCLTCSSFRCLSCQTNYTLNATTQKCEQDEKDGTKTITTVSELPVPFPFLIGLIIIIILAFLIRIQFNKMFIVIFIYAFAGVTEVGSLGLWITLIYTRGVLNSQQSLNAQEGQPYILKIAATAVCLVYVCFNFLSILLYLIVTKKDRKYAVWQRQDNRCSAFFVALFSFLISFRLSLIKFSKLAHKQAFSAPLSKDSNLAHLTVFAYLSIFLISLPAIGVAGYIGYLQITQNYLFFTCIQVAVMGVIMIILSLLQALIPQKYILQKKQDYRHGYDQQGMDGQSLDQVLDVDVAMQQHFYGKQIPSENGEELRAENTNFNIDDQQYQRGSYSSDMFGKINKQQHMTGQLSQVNQRQQLDDILIQAQKLAAKLNQPSRPIGSIKKQTIQQLQSYTEQSQSIGSPQQDDQPPPIDMPFEDRRKYKNRLNLSPPQQQHKSNDIKNMHEQIQAGMLYSKKKLSLNRVTQLYKYIQEQQKQQKSLRERLQNLNQKQKQIKQKQYEKARQLMERNQMAIEDQLGRVGRILQTRRQKDKQRNKKLQAIKQQRKKDKQERQKQRKQLYANKNNSKTKTEPGQSKLIPEQHLQQEDIDNQYSVKKIKVRQKSEVQNFYTDKQINEIDDQQINTNGADQQDDWLNQQNKVNFLPSQNWQMPPAQDLQRNIQQVSQKGYNQQIDRDGGMQQNVEVIHWPIDPQLQQKITEVEQRAQYYIKNKKKKPSHHQQPIQQIQTPDYEMVYNDQQIMSDDEKSEPEQNNFHPTLKINEKSKVRKGRVNKNIIDLSPDN